MSEDQPVISAEQTLPEMTLKALILSLVLALVLAASNAYLALKVGILTSASIPAAILSMGILRYFKRSNILENNLVQTCASTGEAVAGGIVYTIPGLIIIHYWTHFPYWQSFAISCFSGLLGVMFSVPLRRVLLNEPQLRFPEGRAIAEVLQVNNQSRSGFKEIFIGGGLGGLIVLAQNALKVFADSVQVWVAKKNILFGFGLGFSPALIGAGYLIGFSMGVSLLLGALISWLVCVPAIAHFYAHSGHGSALNQVMGLWGSKIRYIGIGAMLVAGLWTLLSLVSTLVQNVKRSLSGMWVRNQTIIPRTDRDISIAYVLAGIVLIMIFFWFLFRENFPLSQLGVAPISGAFIAACIAYILIMGFMVCAICGYFSGMVGVSASPGSSAIIAGMLLAALMIRSLIGLSHDAHVALAASAVTIILGAVITGAAAITNDNIQDLKVGQLVGATPWKQQLMLMLGAVVGSAVIPLIMENLFNVYGIGNVFPRAGMDPSQALPAPPAAMLAAVAQAVFNHNMPWSMFLIGASIAFFVIVINLLLPKKSLSVLGVATGMYLPVTSTTPLFIGAMVAYLTDKALRNGDNQKQRSQKATVLACGLVAGSALMDVFLSIPYAFSKSANIFAIMPQDLHWLATLLGIAATVYLCWRMRRTIN